MLVLTSIKFLSTGIRGGSVSVCNVECKPSSKKPIIQQVFVPPSLWVDEESTDNPISTVPVEKMNQFCEHFDPVKQFHQLFKIQDVFRPSISRSIRRRILHRVNIATLELIGIELRSDA